MLIVSHEITHKINFITILIDPNARIDMQRHFTVPRHPVAVQYKHTFMLLTTAIRIVLI